MVDEEQRPRSENWNTEPSPQVFETLPDRPFYTLQAYYQQVGGQPETVSIEISVRDPSSDPDLTIRITNISKLVWAAVKYTEKLVSRMPGVPNNERTLVAVEGMMVYVGLPILEYVCNEFATGADYDNKAFEAGDPERLLSSRHYKPYSIQHMFAIGMGTGRIQGITLREKNDKRRISKVADDLDWPVALVTELCLIAAMALGEELYAPSIVKTAKDEINHLVRTLNGEFDPPKRRKDGRFEK